MVDDGVEGMRWVQVDERADDVPSWCCYNGARLPHSLCVWLTWKSRQ
jgi:hypothetical protein